MKTLRHSVALAAMLLMLLPAVWAQGGAQKMPPPRVYAMVFKADWCANCRALGPKAMTILPAFIPKGVIPVQLDMTNQKTSATALAAAGKLGLRKLAEGEDGTGFIVLVDARTKTKLGKITANMTPDEMKSAFERALTKTSARS